MGCRPIRTPHGVAIICDRSRQRPPKPCSCGAPSEFLCDWKIGKTRSGKAKTCDKPICKEHGLEVAPDRHLCPEHQRAYADWLDRHPRLL